MFTCIIDFKVTLVLTMHSLTVLNSLIILKLSNSNSIHSSNLVSKFKQGFKNYIAKHNL